MSIEYGILCPYTAFVGVQKYSSQKEKDRIAQLIEYHQRKEQEDKDKEYKKCQGSGSMQIFVRMNGKLSVIHIDPKATFHEFQKMVELKAGVPINMQRILYHGKQLNEDAPIESYGFKNNCDVHLTLRSRGGGYSPYPERTFCKTSDDDLVSIVSEQKVEGCWLNIPSFFTRSKDQKIKTAIQKVQQWAGSNHFNRDEKKVIATVISLFYFVIYKKDLRSIWKLVYEKVLKWLNSINSKICWESIIKSL